MALECKWNVNFKSARKRERRIIIYAETETFGKQNGKLRGKDNVVFSLSLSLSLDVPCSYVSQVFEQNSLGTKRPSGRYSILRFDLFDI